MRVGVICPGRGTYTSKELGSLSSAGHLGGLEERRKLLHRADTYRKQAGRKTTSELDQAERFRSIHLRGENAAALIFLGSAQDWAVLPKGLDVVAVCGNSMGWYSALHVAGVLGFDDGFRLADTMGSYQLDGVVGGQIIYPLLDDEWRRDMELEAHLQQVMDELGDTGAELYRSIHLGGFEVIAGPEESLRLLMDSLPGRRLGERDYPFQLQGHSAFHSRMMEPTSLKAYDALAELPWARPKVHLIDGRGAVNAPEYADPKRLREYTLGHQVTRTFDFTASVRMMLREFAPDALVLLGPGETLGGAIAHILIQQGYRGIRSKRDFLDRQQSGEPVLISLARADQVSFLKSQAGS